MYWYALIPCITHRCLHNRKREKILITQHSHSAYRKLIINHWMLVACYMQPVKKVNEAIQSKTVPRVKWNIGCLVKLFEEILFHPSSETNQQWTLKLTWEWELFTKHFHVLFISVMYRCLLYPVEHVNSLGFRIREGWVQHLF